MTIAFWFSAALLILIAFAFILPPLLRKPLAFVVDSSPYNIDIAKGRLRELKAQLQADVLTQEQFDEQYQELQATLADDLAFGHSVKKTVATGRWLALIILCTLPFAAVLLYAMLGNPGALVAADNTETDQIKTMVAGLAKRLQQQPDDAEGWLMLGRSYQYLKQYERAVAAFEQTYRLVGDRTDILLHYADALAMANNGVLTGKPARLIAKALELTPDDPTALWLAGMAEVEAGRNETALNYWRILAKKLPPNSESLKELQAMMATVTGQTRTQPSKSPAVPVKLWVNVEVVPDILAKTEASDTVFIYAQALQGPPMPLVVVKKQVSDLPVSVELNDDQAMMPALKLSNFGQIKISARISKSGQAQTQPGDFIGRLTSVATDTTDTIEILIDQEIN